MNPGSQEASRVIDLVIREDEGGWTFTDRKNDAGGPTYGGMTFRALREWQRGRLGKIWTDASFRQAARDASAVLRADVVKCYHDSYWVAGGANLVPSYLRRAHFSNCVNVGTKTGIKVLQEACNAVLAPQLVVDGDFGAKTKAAAARLADLDPATVLMAFSDCCMRRYVRIVQANAREWREAAQGARKAPRVLQAENLMGWWNRCRRYRRLDLD